MGAGAILVGLTGGIGSGKSTVAEMLAGLGARVIDADKIGHEVYQPGTDGFRQVVEAFGPTIVGADGAIDRKALGAIVFGDPARLADLNRIVHPLIGLGIRDRIAAARDDGAGGPIVVEAAIMLEARWTFFDRVWVVSVTRETAIARVLARNPHLTRDDVERRLAAQMSDDERRARAQLVIDNNGSLAALRTAVEQAWRTLVG